MKLATIEALETLLRTHMFHTAVVALTSRLLIVASFGLVLAGCQADRPTQASQVAGHYIAVLNDADMTESAYESGDVSERAPGAKDVLTIIALPIERPITPNAQIEVSNSALGPTTALAASRDGRYVFVAEYRGPAGAGTTSVRDLPKGKVLTAIDLLNPLKPKIVAKLPTGDEPSSVAVHPAGDLVAIVTGQARQQIVMAGFKNGAFVGEPVAWPLIGLDNDEGGASSVAWHPAGQALAVTLRERGEVAFYRFKREGGSMALAPWGESVKVGRSPFVGAFTPDGRHFLVSDYRQAGAGVGAGNAGGSSVGPGAGLPQGRVAIIRVGDMPANLDSAKGGPGQHVVIGYAEVGIQPIGMTISSDGRMVATVNLIASASATSDKRVPAARTRGGSISLFRLNSDGTTKAQGEFPINAVPAGIAFDASDRYLIVTQFRSFDPGAKDGEVAFFTLSERDGQPVVESMNVYIETGNGPHGVLMMR